MQIDDRNGYRVVSLDTRGETISTTEQTSDLIGNAWFEHVDVVAVPVSRLDPAFFELRSGFAGELAQKAVNYQLVLAVIGDVSGFESHSTAFGDFVSESNRGEHVWFCATQAELDARLTRRGPKPSA